MLIFKVNSANLAVSKIRLDAQMDELNDIEGNLQNSFLKNTNNEKDFVDSVTKKYGDGTFNPETGIFTPNKIKINKKTTN